MKKIYDFFDDKTRFAFKLSMILMLIAHAFCFLNVLFTHDSLGFFDTEGMAEIRLGRWLYPVVVQSRSFATPWLMGVLSIIYVSLAVALVIKLFDFDKPQIVCVAVLFTTNISLTALFCTYIDYADADCLALLLSCFAVYASRKYTKVLNIVIPALSLVLCLGLYQAYIDVAIGLFLLALIDETREAYDWNQLRIVVLRAAKDLFILILATVIYLPVMHIVSDIFSVELSTNYNGSGNLSSLTFNDVISAVPKTYEYIKFRFFGITAYNTEIVVSVNILLAVVLAISIVLFAYEHRDFLWVLLFDIPCIVLFPLAINAIYLVSMGTIHFLMIFSFCFIYLLPLILMRHTDSKEEKNGLKDAAKYCERVLLAVAVGVILFVGYNNIVYSNGAYVYKKLVFENTVMHAQTIWKDINSIEGYDEGETSVVFVGDFRESRAQYDGSVADRYYNVLTGCSKTAITSDEKIYRLYYGVLGRNLKFERSDKEILQMEEFIQMPVYPQDGYCKMIGDRVVVKMSE